MSLKELFNIAPSNIFENGRSWAKPQEMNNTFSVGVFPLVLKTGKMIPV